MSKVRPEESDSRDSARNLSEANGDCEAERRKASLVYGLFLVAYLSVQFGHGSNIGVAVSLADIDPKSSKAMNLALGSWVMVGVCVGLLCTPWVCRRFGVYQVCKVCIVLDVLMILAMLWPNITMPQIYAIRFLVGFFEAPFLPYLQEWLARHGKRTWNVWNSVMHSMVPIGENIGYIIAQELVASGFAWQWAFLGQAVVLALSVVVIYVYGSHRYLDLPADQKSSYFEEEEEEEESGLPPPLNEGGVEVDDTPPDGQVEYPVTERWAVYWATNASLASQLGFLSGSKYVIRDYGILRHFSLHTVIFTFSATALIGPALGGAVAMSGSLVRPDRWSQHKRTLAFLACTSTTAAALAVMLPYIPEQFFWGSLFATFVAAGGVYPAAQGIINIALTESRVIEASVWQVQCNNVLFAMPMPYLIGKCMDVYGVEVAWKAVIFMQVLAAAGFVFSIAAATFTEERQMWNRWADPARGVDSEEVPLNEHST